MAQGRGLRHLPGESEPSPSSGHLPVKGQRVIDGSRTHAREDPRPLTGTCTSPTTGSVLINLFTSTIAQSGTRTHLSRPVAAF